MESVMCSFDQLNNRTDGQNRMHMWPGQRDSGQYVIKTFQVQTSRDFDSLEIIS